MSSKKKIVLIVAVVTVVALIATALVACANNKSLLNVINADKNGYIVANYGKGFSLYDNKNKQVIKDFYDYMEIEHEGYVSAQKANEKGVNLMDYTGNVLIDGVKGEFIGYSFTCNKKQESEITAMGTDYKKIEQSVAYITATRADRTTAIFSPKGELIAEVGQAGDTVTQFSPIVIRTDVTNGVMRTQEEKYLAFSVQKITTTTGTTTTTTSEQIDIYDANFKNLHSGKSDSFDLIELDNDKDFAYIINDSEDTAVIVNAGGKRTIKAADYNQPIATSDNSIVALKPLNSEETEIYNVYTGKSFKFNGTVTDLSYLFSNEKIVSVSLSGGAKKYIDINSMQEKLSLESGSLSAVNKYFYADSANSKVYDASFNVVADAVSARSLVGSSDAYYTLIKKADNTSYLYKNGAMVSPVDGSFAYNSTYRLFTYTKDGVKQYVHISNINNALFTENNLPSTISSVGSNLYYCTISNTDDYTNYIYTLNAIYSMKNVKNTVTVSDMSVRLYDNKFGKFYDVQLTNASEGDSTYEVILVDKDSIRVITKSDNSLSLINSGSKLVLKNDEKYYVCNTTIDNNKMNVELKDYSSIQNISEVTDKYVVTKHPSTRLGSVYYGNQVILPAIYLIDEIKGDYVVFQDPIGLYGLIQLNEKGYKIVEKAKYTSITISSKGIASFEEIIDGEEYMSLKNLNTNKFIIKKAFMGFKPISIAESNIIDYTAELSMKIMYCEKKGGDLKLVTIDSRLLRD